MQTPSAVEISLPSKENDNNIVVVLKYSREMSVNGCLLGATSCSLGEKALNAVDWAVEAYIGFGSVESIPSCVDQYYAIHGKQ